MTCLLENAVPALWPAACDRPAWLKLQEHPAPGETAEERLDDVKASAASCLFAGSLGPFAAADRSLGPVPASHLPLPYHHPEVRSERYTEDWYLTIS